jgi:molybdopterin-guanine dinucleotide biosynthesis protein B
MLPIVSIVGKSKSGKTTLIEKLIGELNSRGCRVATIKHTPEGMSSDEPGKDSWRHINAGSEATAISSPDKIVLIKPVTRDITLDEIAHFLGEDYDIILTEGFKQGSAPKIEVHRKEVGPPLSNIKKLIAIATDEILETKTRQFSLEDVRGLADFLEKGFIKPQRERVSLYVNNGPISLSAFPREIITNVVLTMAKSLRGVGKVRSLEIFLRKEPEEDQ